MESTAARLRFSTLRAKLPPAIPSRQHNSLTPTLMLASATSSRRSSGQSLPSARAYHRLRRISIRPLMLRPLRTDRPLLALALPDASLGGGKTRLRGVDPHLHGLLEGPSLQLNHRIPNRHLRSVDH